VSSCGHVSSPPDVCYDVSTRQRILISLTTTAVGAVALTAALAQSSPATTSAKIRQGGTFRVVLPSRQLDYVDPALSYTLGGWALLDTACARLMNYPDKPPPAGFRLVPEVAAGYPRVSNGGKTYTFTLRRRFRFSNGQPVQASAFARAINRTLVLGFDTRTSPPSPVSPGAQYTRAIAGAEDVLAGRRTSATGVVARGYRLVVTLTRPVPDFPAQTTMPFFCAVPPTLPADPEGRRAFPGSGPYYIAEYRSGQRIVVRRNRFYRGGRPHHVDRFVVDLGATEDGAVLDRIERGQADSGYLGAPAAYFEPGRRLVAKYGVNKSRFFLKPGLALRGFTFNTSRGLFRNNARLRRAVNFAIDRAAIVRAAGGPLFGASLTDQYLPPSMPGVVDARLYPLRRPDLRRARALARGRARSGKAALYTPSLPLPVTHAQLVKRDLEKIGIDVEITAVPPNALFSRLMAPDAPWDITILGWLPDYVDPYAYINLLLDGRFAPAPNIGRFNSSRYNRLMRRAALGRGRARYRAYADLDVRLARDAAPLLPVAFTNEPTLVSSRVDPRCVVLRPRLDLTAVCLKR
jgi:peptide/nickel transport system substrate-binding protein